MRLFKTTFPALWLGGVAIIRATDEKEAFLFLAKECLDRGLTKAAPNDIEMQELQEVPGILYFDSGDY